MNSIKATASKSANTVQKGQCPTWSERWRVDDPVEAVGVIGVAPLRELNVDLVRSVRPDGRRVGVVEQAEDDVAVELVRTSGHLRKAL